FRRAGAAGGAGRKPRHHTPALCHVAAPQRRRLRHHAAGLFAHHGGRGDARRSGRGPAAHRPRVRPLHRREAANHDRDPGRYGRPSLRRAQARCGTSAPAVRPGCTRRGARRGHGPLLTASRPVILGGVELHRYGLMAAFRRLVETSRVPVATTLVGKTVISEHHPQAIGVYEGGISRREVRDIVDQALYLSIGYALPATLGAALADPARRPVTLIGDG